MGSLIVLYSSIMSSSLIVFLCLLPVCSAYIPPIISMTSSLTPQRTTTRVALSNPFWNPFGPQKRNQLKSQILTLASQTKRGLTATQSQKDQMLQLFQQLETFNPTLNPLRPTKNQPSVNGDWSLEYTTSDSILGKGGFPRVGKIVQTIDTDTLSAKNSEVVRYFGVINVPRSVTAALEPVNGKLTKVTFVRFLVGPFAFDAPNTFRGSLEITYLDDDMRLTRGDKGNIFVLTRM